MRKPIAILAALILAAGPNFRPQNVARIPGIGGSAAVTWTFVQSIGGNCENGTYNTAAYVCTFNATTTAGDLLIMAMHTVVIGPVTSTSFTSVSGDSTWTHCPASSAAAAASFKTDCAYILSAAGGSSTFTVTWTSNQTGTYQWILIVDLIEARRFPGTATYDTGGATTSGSCTSCTSPALTLTGSKDYISQFAAFNNTLSSGPGGAYTNPADLANNSGMWTGVSGALNQTSGSAVTWSPSSAAADMSGVAFK